MNGGISIFLRHGEECGEVFEFEGDFGGSVESDRDVALDGAVLLSSARCLFLSMLRNDLQGVDLDMNLRQVEVVKGEVDSIGLAHVPAQLVANLRLQVVTDGLLDHGVCWSLAGVRQMPMGYILSIWATDLGIGAFGPTPGP